MGKASDSLREERRKVLGHWVAVCVDCGGGRRWFEEFEEMCPDDCPVCGGRMLRRCPHCQSPFQSLFSVDCEACGKQMRPPIATASGLRIRKEGAKPTPPPSLPAD